MLNKRFNFKDVESELLQSWDLKGTFEFKIQKDNPIIDVGGGESKFVDYLIDNGYENISVLDISENAINRAKDRIGFRSKFINWIVCDINDFEPEKNELK